MYDLIRGDILSGNLAANQRLKVSALAARYGTSTNPVREALQQLRGEGFVVIEPNRGARVRPVDEAFVRDISEIAVMIESHFTRWFVDVATEDDVVVLDRLRIEMEELDFRDPDRHSALDSLFHRVMYERHPNRHAFEIWWRHRQILAAISVSRKAPVSKARRAAVFAEHRELVECTRANDSERAARVIAAHVTGAGAQLVEALRAGARPSRRRTG